jgi:gliding motility-associated protein GldM
MGKITKKKISPRQKMINLMYVVMMAMLALNVSSDVLKGFDLVDEKLTHATENSARVNEEVYKRFEQQYSANPAKVKVWYDKAQVVRGMTDSLYTLLDDLKLSIVKKSDGEEADVNNIRRKDDLEAATQVMLAPVVGRGEELHEGIVSYRERVVAMLDDDAQRELVESNLNTDVPMNAKLMGKNWQEYMFESMPTSAAVTILSKLQNDIRYAEGQVLNDLVRNIDEKDIRVNQLNAYVIPSSRTVVQGGKFSAQIIMAAVDTTRHPVVYIGGKAIDNEEGIYETIYTRTGDFTLKGYMETQDGEGKTVKRDFEQQYTVVAPSATVSADIMNVLYAGYDNPISVSVPGVPTNQVSLSMTGGNLKQVAPGKYIAVPTNVGGDAEFTVSARQEGRSQVMGKFTYRVRKLPDPTAFIPVGDNQFKGGKIAKQQLMAANGIGAAIDDGLLNIPFSVKGFETVFFDNLGNAVPEVSNGAGFTDRQKNMMRSLSRGKRFFITKIRAQGPDGLERTLNGALEVIVN